MSQSSSSILLKRFLKKIGQSVLFINTIVVALSNLSKTEIEKIEKIKKIEKDGGLSIYWQPKESKDEMDDLLKNSRRYVLSSSLVLVQDSLIDYVNALSRIRNVNSKDNAVDKIKATFIFAQKEQEIPKYWFPMLVLLVFWRNKIVHNSDSRYPKEYKEILIDSFDEIKSNHASIDINKTLENFDNNKITLKDFSTFISIAIKSVKIFDKALCYDYLDEDKFIAFIKIDDSKYKANLFYLNKILSVQPETKRKSKFSNFILKNYGIDGPLNIDLNLLHSRIKHELSAP